MTLECLKYAELMLQMSIGGHQGFTEAASASPQGGVRSSARQLSHPSKR